MMIVDFDYGYKTVEATPLLNRMLKLLHNKEQALRNCLSNKSDKARKLKNICLNLRVGIRNEVVLQYPEVISIEDIVRIFGTTGQYELKVIFHKGES
jgi:hypothetical protein